MKVFKLRRSRNRVHPQLYYPILILSALLVAAIVALSVGWTLKARSDRALESGKVALLDGIQTHLNETLRTHDRIGVTGIDIENDILPTMRLNLFAAEALNDALTTSYGAACALLDKTDFSAMDDAVDKLGFALETGQPTAAAKETLAACLTEMETKVAQKLEGETWLLTRTALR